MPKGRIERVVKMSYSVEPEQSEFEEIKSVKFEDIVNEIKNVKSFTFLENTGTQYEPKFFIEDKPMYVGLTFDDGTRMYDYSKAVCQSMLNVAEAMKKGKIDGHVESKCSDKKGIIVIECIPTKAFKVKCKFKDKAHMILFPDLD